MLRKLRIGGKNAKTSSIEQGKTLTINMERAENYKNLYYDFKFTIHLNSKGWEGFSSPYDLLKRYILNMKFITGAGDNLFDLNTTEMLIINLLEEGHLRFVPKTSVSTDKRVEITLRWNFTLPKNYQNPLDTVFHSDDPKYNTVQVRITPQKKFVETNGFIDAIDVSITEVFKLKPKLQVIGGKYIPALNKVILVKDFGFNSTVKSQTIELPKNTTILGMYVYVVDENDDIVNSGLEEDVTGGGIIDISLRNGTTYFMSGTFQDFNEDTRDMLDTWSDGHINHIAYIDIANGQITEALNTASPEHLNTVLNFSLKPTSNTNILKILYVTVEDA